MNNELFKHEKSDTIKWIIAFTLIAVLIFGVIAAIFIGIDNKKDEQPQEEQTVVTDGDGNAMESGTVYAMPTNMVFATTAAEQSNAAEGITLQATITPDTADNKAVDWNVSFVNSSSSWASGKTVSDYVTVTPASDGALTATVNCLKAFGEQIKITVVSRANEYASAECTLDYARRILDTALYHEKLDTNILEFGSDEVLIDMVIPNYEDFMTDRKDETIWAGGYGLIWLYHGMLTPEEENDPLVGWADEYIDRTMKFSDYTIKDCMAVAPVDGSEYALNIEEEWSVPDELQVIFSSLATSVNEQAGLPVFSFEQISRNGVYFGNNPIEMAFEMFERSGVRMTNFDADLYELYTRLFVEWIKANPDTPFVEYTMTFTGKYSTFTRHYSFRFNPETAVMPVFGVSLDKETVVI